MKTYTGNWAVTKLPSASATSPIFYVAQTSNCGSVANALAWSTYLEGYVEVAVQLCQSSTLKASISVIDVNGNP